MVRKKVLYTGVGAVIASDLAIFAWVLLRKSDPGALETILIAAGIAALLGVLVSLDRSFVDR